MYKGPHESLLDLRNLGPKSVRVLADAGVETVQQLQDLGATAVYRRLKEMAPGGVSLNMLWALQGALMDMDFREIPDEIKAELKRKLANDM